MIRREEERKVTINEKMRGGEGEATLRAMLTPEEMYGKGRLFSTIALEPGASIGYHVHENEMETFYVVRGTAAFDDNGEKTTLRPGDTAYTPAGHGHSLANAGEDTLEVVALIVFA